METEAIFESIAERIIQEIGKAKQSVFLAVAWFTNKDLFNELLNRALNGCTIKLIISNDRINRNSQIDFSQLKVGKSCVYKVGDGESELMHNKFCIIDHNTVITGSYNWSYKAESNYENILITQNDTALAEQFIAEFNRIIEKHFPNEPKPEFQFPLPKILKRLEILLNYIILEDIPELRKEANKLKSYDFNTDINEILTAISKEEYSIATLKIQLFISNNLQLTIWIDPELNALKLEIKLLENKLNAFDNERIELEKVLSNFHHRHTVELGDIILEILKLRKIKFKNDEKKYKETINDEKQYRKEVSTEKQKEIFKLTTEEQAELKKKFRKATFLCHPDKVSDEFKDEAHNIFIELKNAYNRNDLKRVSEILKNLESGMTLKMKSVTITEKEALKATIMKLKHQIQTLENQISEIKQSEAYKTVQAISDWNSYFNKTKELLLRELEDLQKEVGIN